MKQKDNIKKRPRIMETFVQFPKNTAKEKMNKEMTSRKQKAKWQN